MILVTLGTQDKEFKRLLKAVDKAIENKARTIVYDNEVKFKKQKGINYLLVDSVKVFMGRLFKEIIDQLDKKPIMIGVTGTSGKTTCTRLLYNYLKKECYDVLLIGTHKIYSYYGLIEEMVKTKNTTINLAYLYELLRHKKFDYDYVVMEVSSEGIMEGRILGIDFEVVSVTNVSSDHLNYHKSIEAYVLAKEKLLYNTNKNIILNIDDESYSKYKDVTINKVVTYGVNRGQIKAYNLNLTNTSTSFKVKDQNKYYLIETNLVGRFNVYNILNVWSIIRLLDLRIEPFIKMLKNCEVPLGRMNFKKVGKSLFIVDYAHTINEVNSVFDYLKDLKNNKKVVTVIGCGGNRDATKRSIIGKTVTLNSDYVIFTEDNSRNESFSEIINDLTCDIKINNYEVIENRINLHKSLIESDNIVKELKNSLTLIPPIIEKALEKGLDHALLVCYGNTIKSLVDRNLKICFQTIEIYNNLLNILDSNR